MYTCLFQQNLLFWKKKHANTVISPHKNKKNNNWQGKKEEDEVSSFSDGLYHTRWFYK